MINILKILFPDDYSCLICNRDIFDNDYLICNDCNNNLPFITGNICMHCSEPLVSDGYYCKRCKGSKFIVDRAIAPFYYKDNIKNLIYDLKYSGRKYIAKSLSKYMSDYFIKNNFYADIIVPVPLCDKRYKQRGYNQSELLAKEISTIINVNIKLNILKRVKETPTQTNLTFIERQKNLKDSFKVVNKRLIKDKVILLIDDVYTTGATIKECAKVLKDAGCKVVYALTASHTILKGENNE